MQGDAPFGFGDRHILDGFSSERAHGKWHDDASDPEVVGHRRSRRGWDMGHNERMVNLQ